MLSTIRRKIFGSGGNKFVAICQAQTNVLGPLLLAISLFHQWNHWGCCRHIYLKIQIKYISVGVNFHSSFRQQKETESWMIPSINKKVCDQRWGGKDEGFFSRHLTHGMVFSLTKWGKQGWLFHHPSLNFPCEIKLWLIPLGTKVNLKKRVVFTKKKK